jgi:hypothetical protein
MVPINFSESNKELQKPATMTDQECSPLPTFTDGKQSISCWKPSWKERFSILFFGRVWLSVFSGETQPPVWLDGSRTVFEKTKASTE